MSQNKQLSPHLRGLIFLFGSFNFERKIMEVVQNSENITHVILGQELDKKSMETANDATFFYIMSTSLYKEPLYAMVRETICNAWDAHIDAETDRMVEITIDSNYLTIRDFGKGIPNDIFHSIYGIVGGSTKRHISKATGGFGLGCKTPFAHTDTFTVTSMNEGKKAIYILSKSTGAADGLPSISTIMKDVPTSESGLEVKIPVHDKLAELTDAIKSVIYIGQDAVLNGKTLNSFLVPNSNGFLYYDHDTLYDNKSFLNKGKSGIYVKYGNVAYEVDVSRTSTYFRTKVTKLKFIRGVGQFIFFAKPDSLAITPNREELSYLSKTQETLDSMMKEFVIKLSSFKGTRQDAVNEQFSHLTVSDVISGFKPRIDSADFYKNVDNFEKLSLIRKVQLNRYATTLELYRVMLHKKLLEGYKHDKRFFINTDLDRLSKIISDNYRKLLVKLPEGIQKSNFMVATSDNFFVALKKRIPTRNSYGGHNKVYYKNYFVSTEQSIREFGFKYVVISTSKTYKDKLKEYDSIFKDVSFSHFFCKVPLNNPQLVKQAVDFFTGRGYNVINLTEVSLVKPDKPSEPKKKRTTPLSKTSPYKLSNFYTKGKDSVTNNLKSLFKLPAEGDTLPLATDYDWVVNLDKEASGNYYSNDCNFENYDLIRTNDILFLWGSSGAITNRKIHYAALKKAGKKTLEQFLKEKMLYELDNNQDLIKAMYFNHSALQGNIRLIRLIKSSDVLTEYVFGKDFINYSPEYSTKILLSLILSVQARDKDVQEKYNQVVISTENKYLKALAYDSDIQSFMEVFSLSQLIIDIRDQTVVGRKIESLLLTQFKEVISNASN